MLTPDHLKTLSAPFPKERLGIKIQSLSKDRTKAGLVCYLQHTDVYDRLESVDSAWSCEITGEQATGEQFYVRMKMTVCHVTRENVGDGDSLKGATSDALKRVAMLFGVGRYLYDTETVWVAYNEAHDKYRTWSFEDFNRALRPNQARTPVELTPVTAPPPALKVIGAIKPESSLSMLSRTPITFGKYKDMVIGHVPINELLGYRTYIVNKGNQDGKTIQGEVKTFIEVVNAYELELKK